MANISHVDLAIQGDNRKILLGAGDDASIDFDGNSLNIIANTVTSTDTMNLTAKTFLLTGDNATLTGDDSQAIGSGLTAGGAFIGFSKSINGSEAIFAHKNFINDQNAFAFLQNAAGRTFFNSKVGKDMNFNIGNVTKARMDANGDFKLILDNQKLLFGAAGDASIYYDGTDLIVNPVEVGTGSFKMILNSDQLKAVDIDGTSTALTSTGTSIGINYNRTINTASGNTPTMADGGIFSVTNNWGYNGGGTSPLGLTNLGLKGSVVNNASHSSAPFAGINEFNLGVIGSISRIGTITTDGVTIDDRTGSFSSSCNPTFNASGGTLTIKDYGQYTTTNTHPTSTDGDIVITTYGNYSQGRVAGGARITSTAYGVWTEATGADTNWGLWVNAGDMALAADNQKLFLGAGQDVSILYNGTDLIIDPKEVGSGGLRLKNGAELKFSDIGDSNYVGFKAPTLTANQIWALPDADGKDGDVMFTDGAGNLKWGSNASTRSWIFDSPAGSSGTFYFGGFYKLGASANDFNPAINFGTANSSYAAHAFVVQAAGASGGTDTVVTVSGTSILDDGTRTAADSENLTVDDAGSAGVYYETTKKWIGQVTFTKLSGPDLLMNYGLTKYWDDNNEDFKVEGIEVTWLGGANDANPNIILRHHTATGWTYNAGAAPTPPTAIADMNTDHVTEIQVVNNENGAWKRDNLSTNVNGSGSEGTILEIVTTANKTFELGNILLRVVPQ